MMDTIFCNVEADIDDYLIMKFPKDFDFDSMLKRVCNDAGVSVVDLDENMKGVSPSKNYRLKGFWINMEKAYNHLVTSLSLYGSRLSSENPIETSSFIEASGVLKTTQGKIKHSKPKKSTKRTRKIKNKDVEDLEDGLEPADSCDIITDAVSSEIKHIDSRGLKSLDAVNRHEDVKDFENGEVGKDDSAYLEAATKHVEDAENDAGDCNRRHSKRRVSARKRKYTPPYDIKEEKTEDSDASSHRKRGRPKQHGEAAVKEFPCSECSFVTNKRSKLNTHRVKNHEVAPITCDLCPKVFLSKTYMLRHRASHTEPQHCCDVCGKMYKVKKAMLEHRKTHDVAYEKPKVTCEQCSKTFCNRYILECHIKDVHLGQKKSYLCATCGKSFTTRHSLTEHTNAHTGVKPHVCEICGKSFSYESALRDHRFTHEESKHFWCKHCQKGFSQRSGLKMHMRIHRQQKMFVCTECGRGFTQKQALQRHERVHKGEKPFVCKHCGRLFTDASIIRRHLILVHKINKDAKAWREDIVCTVKPQNEYLVQKIGVEDDENEAERAKNELFVKAVGGAQTCIISNKGPSRAFCRTYPRRVALLDEQGNVIAPPETSQQSLASKLKQVNEVKPKENGNVSISVQSNQIIMTSEVNNSDLRVGSHVLSHKYVEPTQWEPITQHLVPRDNNDDHNNDNATANSHINHIEHTIFDKSVHHSQEPLHDNFHKLVKYEMPPGVVTIQGGGVVVGLGDAGIPQSNTIDPTRATLVPSSSFLQQQQQHHSQKHQTQVGEILPSSSPLSFTIPSTQSMISQASFDSLTQQSSHASNMLTPSHIQYFEGRSTEGKNIPTWPSMLYYSQLASQFGMSINTEYPYGSGIVTSSSSPLTGIQICGQPSPPLHQGTSSAATTFILQAQSLPDLEQIVGMKGSQDNQHVTALHLDGCEDHQQSEPHASELAISLQQTDTTVNNHERHLGTVPVADELILLQQNLQHEQHHNQQQQQQGAASTILISQRSSRHQQHQLQEVDLVEQLTGAQNIPADQHSILVRALDSVSGHDSPNLHVSTGEGS
ncbi:hypothetical protein EGW08_013898 [Elysia chlorotica]|uniref:C2H2-type domain-containing protein n=1 Tax=Elysia chlorotica TaxID=188477 RepID=A0A3S1B2J3_ELYCH|nr:hypothetical protein EGW08_013898 [Elysia chlorotica]